MCNAGFVSALSGLMSGTYNKYKSSDVYQAFRFVLNGSDDMASTSLSELLLRRWDLATSAGTYGVD
ncbi:hypothetical protein GQ600_8890 [Phytophthora cactorum]|nr:hypothetical protein GQ600_8890 [Phytophthora cactorum]